MLRQFIQKYQDISADLHASKLYNEDTFYKVFLKDLGKCKKEVIIESPFATTRRLGEILPILEKLKNKGIKIAIISETSTASRP